MEKSEPIRTYVDSKAVSTDLRSKSMSSINHPQS